MIKYRGKLVEDCSGRVVEFGRTCRTRDQARRRMRGKALWIYGAFINRYRIEVDQVKRQKVNGKRVLVVVPESAGIGNGDAC